VEVKKKMFSVKCLRRYTMTSNKKTIKIYNKVNRIKTIQNKKMCRLMHKMQFFPCKSIFSQEVLTKVGQ
jgi:hypothetical protein